MSVVSPITPLLTLKEAATALSISRSKLYELMASGALKHVTFGRTRRITPGDLDDFVRLHTRGGDA